MGTGCFPLHGKQPLGERRDHDGRGLRRRRSALASSIRMAQRYTHTDHRRQLELVDRASAGDVPRTVETEKATGGSE